MPKRRSNFTLSTETIEMLDSVDNKSETVEQAVKYYLLNKDKPARPEIREVENVRIEF